MNVAKQHAESQGQVLLWLNVCGQRRFRLCKSYGYGSSGTFMGTRSWNSGGGAISSTTPCSAAAVGAFGNGGGATTTRSPTSGTTLACMTRFLFVLYCQ